MSRTSLPDMLGIAAPIIQAPMAGADTPALAIAVSNAGGLGSLGCALMTPEKIREDYTWAKSKTGGPVNLNFFCHQQTERSNTQQQIWRKRLEPYYKEFNIDPESVIPSKARVPFNDEYCSLIEDLKPAVISFHFGLPSPPLLRRVKSTGAIILSSATTIEEGIWLEKNGCDVVIAQGKEAGGHRGMFLNNDLNIQPSTATLVKQLTTTLSLPVIAAGGIADAEDIKAMLSYGAAAAQLGTAYLFCPEANVAPLHRKQLGENTSTEITNIFTGRPARGLLNRLLKEVGPIAAEAPDFPYASDYVLPLRKASEAKGSIEFMQMWSGEKRKKHAMGAEAFTRWLREGLG